MTNRATAIQRTRPLHPHIPPVCGTRSHKALQLSVLFVQLSVSLLWLPGVSVFILVQVIGVPHQLALLCINPLRVFSFFCFTGESFTRIVYIQCQSNLFLGIGLVVVWFHFVVVWLDVIMFCCCFVWFC